MPLPEGLKQLASQSPAQKKTLSTMQPAVEEELAPPEEASTVRRHRSLRCGALTAWRNALMCLKLSPQHDLTFPVSSPP